MIQAIRWSIGSMDFDNPKVYGDTSITDGLVCWVVVSPSFLPRPFHLYSWRKGWYHDSTQLVVSLIGYKAQIPPKAPHVERLGEEIRQGKGQQWLSKWHLTADHDKERWLKFRGWTPHDGRVGWGQRQAAMVRSVRPAGKCNDRRVLVLTSDVTPQVRCCCAAGYETLSLCRFCRFHFLPDLVSRRPREERACKAHPRCHWRASTAWSCNTENFNQGKK